MVFFHTGRVEPFLSSLPLSSFWQEPSAFSYFSGGKRGFRLSVEMQNQTPHQTHKTQDTLRKYDMATSNTPLSPDADSEWPRPRVHRPSTLCLKLVETVLVLACVWDCESLRISENSSLHRSQEKVQPMSIDPRPNLTKSYRAQSSSDSQQEIRDRSRSYHIYWNLCPDGLTRGRPVL